MFVCYFTLNIKFCVSIVSYDQLYEIMNKMTIGGLVNGIKGSTKEKTEACVEAGDFDEKRSLQDTTSTYLSEKSDLDGSENSDYNRETWSGQFEALLSYIGYCVGLGNIWRFPYLCYRNGGGAFLIPYFLMLVLSGMPLYFLELGLGQFSGSGAAKTWKFAPVFKGVGYCAIVTSALCCLYYNQLVAYTLLYLFYSMTSQVPWATCNNSWNTPNCMEPGANISLHLDNETLRLKNNEPNMKNIETLSFILVNNDSAPRKTSPAEEFWELELLKISSGIEDLGRMDYKLALTLLLAWIIVFFCLVKGIKSTGKVVYVTATLPYLVLAILLIRGVTLPGALQGLYFYLYPDFNQLKNPRVWGDAASQIFYSLGPCWGLIITYASYHKFDHKYIKDAVITSCVCTGTSVFAGFAIFSVIGFMAHVMQQEIDSVVKAGPGLIFVAYPQALAQMPVAPLWSVLFFIMVLMLALDSMFATFEVAIVAILDEFPKLLKYRVFITATMCTTWFLLGLPQATQGGIYILTLLDWYVGTFPPLFVGLLEVVAISYIYGYSNFERDVESMVGVKPNLYWKISCMGIAPCVILAIIVFNIAIFKPVSFGSYSYPEWAEVLGVCITVTPITCIPIFAFLVYRSKTKEMGRHLTMKETLQHLFKPEASWDGKKIAHSNRLHGNQEMKEYKNSTAEASEKMQML